jgi:hypothetical protein
MTKFENTQRGHLLQELYFSLSNPKHQTIVSVIAETIECLEKDINQLNQSLMDNEKLILKIISTLSPPNN